MLLLQVGVLVCLSLFLTWNRWYGRIEVMCIYIYVEMFGVCPSLPFPFHSSLVQYSCRLVVVGPWRHDQKHVGAVVQGYAFPKRTKVQHRARQSVRPQGQGEGEGTSQGRAREQASGESAGEQPTSSTVSNAAEAYDGLEAKSGVWLRLGTEAIGEGGVSRYPLLLIGAKCYIGRS